MLKINDQEFTMLTDFMKSNFGINLSAKRTLVEGRLYNYVTQRGFEDYSSFLKTVLQTRSEHEVGQLVNYLTTNYSYFMREWDHFQYLRDHVLPEMKQKISDYDLRIWSAGCSSGEEPYTMAMLIRDFFEQDIKRWDAKVLATDISTKALQAAKNGIYDDDSIAKIPAMWKLAYFNKNADNFWQVNDQLKADVIFREFNLMDQVFPFKRKFHVIFCRNVMIYFDQKTKMNLVNKFYEHTEPGGYLFIGQSEAVDRNDTKYRYVMPSVLKKVE